MIREPIVVVGGHVDHGKTTLLDYIRGTTVANQEAGRITQHIGATNVPLNVITKISGSLLERYKFNLKIPGLLFIDTPGHEAFSTLRKRGSTIADIAVLVIDILQGCQPQTYEMIDYLKENKTPFIVALTKVDNIKGYNKSLDLYQMLKEIDEGQTLFAQQFLEKFYKIVGQLSEKGFDSDRFDQVTDFTKKVLMIPVSAKTGLGIDHLLLFLAGLSQKYLESTLTLNVEGFGKATVLEVKEEKGFGKTMDVILYDGMIGKNDYIKIESERGLVVTKIKMLLKPLPLQEIRLKKSKFEHVDMAYAAAGLKIVAPNIDYVGAGDTIYVISKKEADNLKTQIKKYSSVADKGVIVKVDTEGSIEAMQALAKKEKVDIFKAEVGTVTKEDIIEAKLFANENYKYGAIFAFNVKVPLEIQEYAKQQNIKIFASNIIYKIFEDYKSWVSQREEEIKNEALSKVVYPAKFKILPQYIFRQSKPFVCGIEVLEGILKPNVKIIQNNKIIGTLKRMQDNGKDIKEAKKGMQIAVSIDGVSADKVDLNKEIYVYIPLQDRAIVKKYLSEYNNLIKELDEIYVKLNE